MGFWIFPVLGISLGLTIVFEIIFALIFGIRNKKDLLLICLVNILTNPAVVLLYYLVCFYIPWHLNDWIIKIPLEVLAVTVEAYYYKLYGKQFKRPVLFSLFANIFSFSIGILINNIF